MLGGIDNKDNYDALMKQIQSVIDADSTNKQRSAYKKLLCIAQRAFFEHYYNVEVKAEEMAKKYDCPFVDNEMPYGRGPQGHPVIVDYFYHEEIRGSENTGKRNC